MHIFKIKNKEVTINHHHGWRLYDGSGIDKKLLYKFSRTLTDWRKVFKFRNIIKYYWWSLKQYIFWHNVHKPIGEWIKKNTKLNDTPYWGDYTKEEKM